MKPIEKPIRRDLQNLARQNPAFPQRFYKTEPGGYAEHDRFLGTRVPDIRKLVIVYNDLSWIDLGRLLGSIYNEERLLALLILVNRYQKGDRLERDKVYHFYLKHRHRVNNWNLVDSSAHHIIGAYLFDKPRDLLFHLGDSEHWWERRIAIVATWYFIRKNDFSSTLVLAQKLLQDEHDLMHKAVGWMLREVGKRDELLLRGFLKKHAHQIPRTLLRYAIERLPDRQDWLNYDPGQ